jgi:tetratricopeptide (TPR) repeat protein
MQALRWASTLLAELDLLQGRPCVARERLLPLLDRPGLQELDVTFLLPRFAWAQLVLDEAAQARARAAEAVERARRQHYYLALADALRVQGVAMDGTGDQEGAAKAFEQAVVLCRAMPYPYAEALALYEWGMMERRRGDRERGQQRLEEAMAIFRPLGARPYVERTEQALTRA